MYSIECDARSYQIVDDIDLSQYLVIAGYAVDSNEKKLVQVPLGVRVEPNWLIARNVGRGRFSISVPPSAKFEDMQPFEIRVELKAATYETKVVPVALGPRPSLPHTLEVLLRRQPVRLQGTVFSQKTLLPIAGANVTLTTTPQRETVSDASGFYRFEDVGDLIEVPMRVNKIGFSVTEMIRAIDYARVSNEVNISMV